MEKTEGTEKGEKEKSSGEEAKDEESVGGADGEEKEGEDQKEQVMLHWFIVINLLVLNVASQSNFRPPVCLGLVLCLFFWLF